MRVYRIVVDNGQDIQTQLKLALNVRTLKDNRPQGIDYLKVTDETDKHPIDAEMLCHMLEGAGYSDTECEVVRACIAAYAGSTNYIAPPVITRNRKPKEVNENV